MFGSSGFAYGGVEITVQVVSDAVGHNCGAVHRIEVADTVAKFGHVRNGRFPGCNVFFRQGNISRLLQFELSQGDAAKIWVIHRILGHVEGNLLETQHLSEKKKRRGGRT